MFRCNTKTIDQKKRAVVTRPFGRELGLYLKIGLSALISKDLLRHWQQPVACNWQKPFDDVAKWKIDSSLREVVVGSACDNHHLKIPIGRQ